MGEGLDDFDGMIKFVHAHVVDWQRRLTPKVFSDALMYKMDMKKIDRKGADDLARYIINMLTEDGTILDNSLDAEEKSAFYTLEDESLMSTQRYETAILNGKYWRVYQWYPRIENILKYAQLYNDAAEKPREAGEGAISNEHTTLPDETPLEGIWQRHAEQEITARQDEGSLLICGPSDSHDADSGHR